LLGIIVGSMICLFAFVTVTYFHVGKVYDPTVKSQIVMNSKNIEQEFVTLLPLKMHTIKGFTTQ